MVHGAEEQQFRLELFVLGTQFPKVQIKANYPTHRPEFGLDQRRAWAGTSAVVKLWVHWNVLAVDTGQFPLPVEQPEDIEDRPALAFLLMHRHGDITAILLG